MSGMCFRPNIRSRAGDSLKFLMNQRFYFSVPLIKTVVVITVGQGIGVNQDRLLLVFLSGTKLSMSKRIHLEMREAVLEDSLFELREVLLQGGI